MFTSLFHLIYIFLYIDAKTVPVKGGTISEGLIGNFPSLNPLKNLSGNNQYVVGLLYRSLLKYDLEQNKIIGDIANCDINSLVNIECYINDDAIWSNGKKITAEDIYSTYQLIKSTNSNIILNSLLEDTSIEYKENVITFKNNKKDVNFLNVFFQPILSKENIDSLSKENIFGNFPTNGGIYSGDFKISSVSSDLTIGVSKIILDKNEYYNKGNISKIILNIFPDTNTFLKNKQSVNVFNDDGNIVGGSIPRLQSSKYTLPQFVGLFINQNKVTDTTFRNYIFSKINSNNLVELLGKDNFDVVNNPYLTGSSIDKETSIKNFESVMKTLGYYKKSKYIDDLMPSLEATNSSNEVTTSTGTTEPSNDNLTIDAFQKKSEIIVKPTYVEKYNFVTKDDILLEGKVESGVQEVYINDKKLEGFKLGDEKFFYRLKTSLGNFNVGKNNYKIYFVINNNKIFKEEVNFLLNSDKDELNKAEKQFVLDLDAENKKIALEQAETNKIDAEKKKKDAVNQIDKDKFEKVNKLDENIYYDKDLNPFTLRLYYLNTEKALDQTANFVKNSLKELGIEIELVPFDLNSVAKVLSNKDDYDMILTGVNLGYFEFNIFPYFHSSQSKTGYNFSNIKKTSLDILLEELKSDILSEEKITENENKILEILKDEQVIKTLYTPKINLLVDKNLKNKFAYNKLPNKALRSYVLNSSYIKENKIINFENKSIGNFFKFIFKKLYE
ncbi:MAG: ABC transporter substrate-binding protein [Candidatus Gracilibacteria bacterium]|nr:ABC transporter substrate-binding protein [Candidatus Gracilibacteria bacterium]